MAHYDPNDPRYNQAEEMARTTAEPHRPRTDPTADSTAYDQNTYVEPVAGRASPIPLIIGILAALALAYFVLDRFMTREAEQAEPSVTTSQPAPVAPAPAPVEPAPAPVEPTPGQTVEGAMQDAGRSLEQGAAETGAAVDNALVEAGAALDGAAQATGDAVEDAAAAVGEAAQNAADAISNGVNNTTTQPAPAPSN